MNSIELSELIYPEIANDTDYEAMYPHRDLAEGAKVTRLGPRLTQIGRASCRERV